MPLIIHVDGGSRGNPGPAGAGVTIRDEAGRAVFEAGFFLGVMTNNSAEYTGLIRALDAAAAWPQVELIIRSDSELMVRQITGQYKVRHPELAKLYREVQTRLLKRDHWSIRHLMREDNARADELANMAMDAGEDVIVVDRRDESPLAHGDDGASGGDGADSGGGAGAKAKAKGASPARSRASSAQAAAGRASDAAAEPDDSAAAGVEATCTAAPSARVCPAPCRAGDAFIFERCGPADLCLDALAAMLTTAIVLRDTAAAGGTSMPALTVRCARAGCGGAFEMRSAAT